MIELPAAGACQCQATTISVTTPGYVAYTCHCRACQRLSASAFMTCMQVAAEGVTVTRGTPLTFARPTDSGNTLYVTYCGQCSSALFANNSARPRIATIFAGCLQDLASLPVDAHIWLRYKLPWVSVPASHRLFDGAGDWREDYADDLARLLPEGN